MAEGSTDGTPLRRAVPKLNEGGGGLGVACSTPCCARGRRAAVVESAAGRLPRRGGWLALSDRDSRGGGRRRTAAERGARPRSQRARGTAVPGRNRPRRLASGAPGHSLGVGAELRGGHPGGRPAHGTGGGGARARPSRGRLAAAGRAR